MKLLKRTLAIGMVVLFVGVTSFTVVAASQYETPAEAVAALTGRTEDSVVEEKEQTGKTYGEIAAEAGFLEEFKAEILEIKKERLDERVASGDLTQEEADEIIARMAENQADCDGTGTTQRDCGMFGGQGADGSGFGGQNKGQGNGMGQGKGNGQGFGGSCDGSCELA